MWCAIAAYLVVATGYGRQRRSGITVKEMRIAVVDTAGTRVIGAGKVARTLAEGGFDPVGMPIDSLDTHAIETRLAALPEVKRASVWCDLEGVLVVRVEGRTPLLRVRSTGGYRFWLSDDGYIIPDRGEFASYVPVVTGSVPFPFSPSASGSYEAMRRADYNDYLAQFTAMEDERQRLSSELAGARASLRAERASGPKRFWGDERKKRFAANRLSRIAELEAGVEKLGLSLASLASRKTALAEKEKKSHESYLFLTKLANFVGFIGGDGFWSAQIVQINVTGGGGQTSDEWREPQLELIPRAGDHTILLGELDGTERQRLENLRLFYAEGLWHEGWNAYGYINIKYKNQIVCTK